MKSVLILLLILQITLGNPVQKRPPTGITYARQGQTPWTVMIQIRDTRCTGSLIKDKYVITAAHCFDIAKDDEDENDLRIDEDIKIFIGDLDITKDPDCDEDDENADDDCVSEPVAEIPAKEFRVHELYKSSPIADKYKYDVAIITLKRPPRKSEIIQNIELPPESECEENTVSGTLINSGFGEIRHKEYTEIKKITNVNIITNKQECKHLGKQYDELKHLCGKSPSKITTCKGDSGGPLSKNIDGKDYLIGIVSFGTPECSVNDKPSAFVKVDCLIPWITQNTRAGKIKPAVTKPTTTTTTTEAPQEEDDENDFDIFG